MPSKNPANYTPENFRNLDTHGAFIGGDSLFLHEGAVDRHKPESIDDAIVEMAKDVGDYPIE